MTRSRTSSRAALLALAVLGLVLLGAGAAAAQVDAYTIERFDVTIEVRDDGRFTVTEAIDVRFDADRRGIFRRIPVRYDLTADAGDEVVPAGESPSDYWRVIRLEDVVVSAVGAPSDVRLTVPSDRQPDSTTEAEIRIGEEDTFVRGEVAYTITYTVDGALNVVDDSPELYWNVTGNGWDTVIAEARVEVRGATVAQATCFQGFLGASQLCDAPPAAGSSTVAAARDLRPGEGLTVVARLAPGAVAVPDPIVVRRWNVGDAFVGSSAAVPGAVALAVAGLGGLAVLGFRTGRDREVRGAVDVRGHVDTSVPVRRALFAPRTSPVEFRPPDDLRPGQLGLVVDEEVDDVDVAGTLVDLAVRGHLAIEEVETTKAVFFSGTDWRLRRRDGGDDLLPYERTLHDGLFADGDEVMLSDLEGDFATTYAAVVAEIYDDGVDRGWFPRRPDRVRSLWVGIGVGLLVVGIVATVAAVLLTTFALVAAVLPVLGVAVLLSASRMPRRTAAGSALLVRTLGFRRFVTTAEAGRMDLAERERLFVAYLPYAVVFGVVGHWASTFERLGVDVAAVTAGFWIHHGTFSTRSFSDGVQSFSSAASSSLSTAPAASGGSGFSGGSVGGGFGGGGGGSW